jgi:pyridoxine 5-phosphate synthase
MFKIAIRHRPPFICVVPEKRKEITTEGGLNLNIKKNFLKKIILKLQKNKSRVSLFIEPQIESIKKAKLLNANCIEIHTGKFCKLINENKNYKSELDRIKKAVKFANKVGLEVHAGHGLNYKSARILSKLKGIKEFNIGHFLIGESIFVGLSKTIKVFKKIIK